MKYRNECKHIINTADYTELRQRLRAVLKTDPNAGPNGVYRIRSLYFDNQRDKALMEKIDGVNIREKFRIRYYNGDTSLIHLEKKSKINSLCAKEFSFLTTEQAHAISTGDIDWMLKTGDPLIAELYSKMRSQGLKAKTIVDYKREAYVFEPGNVRVTLDYDVRSGLTCTDFLNPDCITVPAGDTGIILEVKWDEFLPTIVRDIVRIEGRRTTAFSKYAACRIYG